VRLDRPDERSFVDLVRDYYLERKGGGVPDCPRCMGRGLSGIAGWAVKPDRTSRRKVDPMALRGWRRSRPQRRSISAARRPVSHFLCCTCAGLGPAGESVLWLDATGKIRKEVPAVRALAKDGFEYFPSTFGTGEDRMEYRPASSDGINSRSTRAPVGPAQQRARELRIQFPADRTAVLPSDDRGRGDRYAFAREAMAAGAVCRAPEQDRTFAVAVERCIRGCVLPRTRTGPCCAADPGREAGDLAIAYLLPGAPTSAEVGADHGRCGAWRPSEAASLTRKTR